MVEKQSKKSVILSIIVVTYNYEKVLPRFLESLKNSDIFDTENGQPFGEIVFKDNGSTDRTIQLLKDSDLGVIHSDFSNVGFAKANNMAYEISHGKYLLFLNADTYFTNFSFKKLVDEYKQLEDVGIMTCRLVTESGVDDANTARNFPNPVNALLHFAKLSRFFKEYSYYIDIPKNLHKIPACGGAFMLINRDFFMKIGKWDEDYFLYGEDIDICYMVMQFGKHVYFNPSQCITHIGGVSTNFKKSGSKYISNEVSKVTMSRLSVDAMRIFWKKHQRKNFSKPVQLLVDCGLSILFFIRTLGLK